ncbi:MAG: ribonuclease HII [Actinomycetes bacterium]
MTVTVARARTARKVTGSRTPTLREERRLLREGHLLVAGMDEVGRGALAGPVTVGVVVVDGRTRSAPPGLRDSKLLTAAAREVLAPPLRRWAAAWAVGHAQPEEVDELGIICALRLAGRRALVQLGHAPGILLLDGNHDWLTTAPPDLLDLLDDLSVVGLPDEECPGVPVARSAPGSLRFTRSSRAAAGEPDVELPPVRTMVKADMRCAAVAAASVLAKTTRDAIMLEHSRRYPQYLWAENKGYAAPEHMAALARFGPSPQHRLSWQLPGVGHCWNGRHDGVLRVTYEQGRESDEG